MLIKKFQEVKLLRKIKKLIKKVTSVEQHKNLI